MTQDHHQKLVRLLDEIKIEFDKAEIELSQLSSFKIKFYFKNIRESLFKECNTLIKNEEVKVKIILSPNPFVGWL